MRSRSEELWFRDNRVQKDLLGGRDVFKEVFQGRLGWRGLAEKRQGTQLQRKSLVGCLWKTWELQFARWISHSPCQKRDKLWAVGEERILVKRAIDLENRCQKLLLG